MWEGMVNCLRINVSFYTQEMKLFSIQLYCLHFEAIRNIVHSNDFEGYVNTHMHGVCMNFIWWMTEHIWSNGRIRVWHSTPQLSYLARGFRTEQGPVSMKTAYPGMLISITKIRRYWDPHISIMGIYNYKTPLYWDGPQMESGIFWRVGVNVLVYGVLVSSDQVCGTNPIIHYIKI